MPVREIAGAIIEVVLKELVGPCVMGIVGLCLEDTLKAIVGEGRPAQLMQQPREPSMQFISDATIPDRSAVLAGAMLDKRWLVRNDSVHGISWPAGSKVVFVRGVRAPNDGDEFPLNELAEPLGQGIEVSARLRVPTTQGRYTAVFRLADPEGKYFGDPLYVDVCVEDDSLSSASGNTADSSSSSDSSSSTTH